MQLPTIDDSRAGRLATLEDEIRRRLWARDREGGERDFNGILGELARQQYTVECLRTFGQPGVTEPSTRTVIETPA